MNQYAEDVTSDNDFYRLRAYTHDVLKSMDDDPCSESTIQDVEDLLRLVNAILESQGINPWEYSESLGRGGSEE